MKNNLQILAFFLFPILGFGQLEPFEKVINLDDEITLLNSNLEELSSIEVSHFWCMNENKRRFGFIGENYRRLKLVYLSVIKDMENPLEYYVYGKSNVADNVCPFQGKITVKDSYYIKTPESPSGNSGILVGDYVFFEDSESHHAGVFKGIFATFWYKDGDGVIRYDDRRSVSALYNNNQFAGLWTAYRKENRRTANWGDSRIPESGNLDVGTSEFAPNRKYQENGWDSFIKAWNGGYSKTETDAARKKEIEKWWKKN